MKWDDIPQCSTLTFKTNQEINMSAHMVTISGALVDDGIMKHY